MIEKNSTVLYGGGIMTELRELDGIHFLFPVGEKTPEKGQKSFTGGDVYHFHVHPA